MGESIRIRTELGLNKSINIELNQEFEFLEILSLKLNQQDIYLRACSDYGVIVGRVTANNGLGLPNARVSIFIPIEVVDESNPIISSIYPYKSPEDKNEDGYRYNLLPYEKSYSTHAATGTLPTRIDVLTGNTAFEIYEKYYKFTAKTNESGDYMIMGVPLGEQTVIMDVDLSDIGEFSLTPQDLVRIGRATETQVAGNRFRTSADLNSLPQIVNLSKSVEISPLWGEPSICQIAINRVDFDLRDDANIDIQPTSVFMGSIFSTSDNLRIRPPLRILGLPFGQRPKDDFGNLCSLIPGVGQILAIRQTISLDVSGNPILEEYRLEQNGNVIDQDGSWVLELPMNLDYLVTNEFGEKIISYDPTIGIPTKAKYRFKIKWIQSNSITSSVRRPYYLVPNVKEYGWITEGDDPNDGGFGNATQLRSSYYFGLDWSGYTNGFTTTQLNNRIDEIINCEDTFYEFRFNRVYTVSGLIDQYKNGGRARFVGIKEIDSNSCEDTVNKFPVNEGYKNFDIIFFIVSLLLQVIQIISIPFIIAIHFLVFFLNVLIALRALLNAFFLFMSARDLFFAARLFASWIQQQIQIAAFQRPNPTADPVGAATYDVRKKGMKGVARQTLQTALRHLRDAARFIGFSVALNLIYRAFNGQRIKKLSLPVLRYPDCEGCECTNQDIEGQNSSNSFTILTKYSLPYLYNDGIKNSVLIQNFHPDDHEIVASTFAQSIGGTQEDEENIFFYKTMESSEAAITEGRDDRARDFYSYSRYLPFGERINLFNTRKKYFDGVNRIKVTFELSANTQHHFDNVLALSFEQPLESGTLLTFVNPELSQDKNYNYIPENLENNMRGVKGVALNSTSSQYTVNYCDPSNSSQNRSVTYNLGKGSTIDYTVFASDLEYYQVITAMTMSDAFNLFRGTPRESLPEVLRSKAQVIYNIRGILPSPLPPVQTTWGSAVTTTPEVNVSDIFDNFQNQYLVILQRGVDPYSPKYVNKFGLGVLFGSTNEDDVTITATTRLNIPIQSLGTSTGMSVQPFTQNGQNEIFYPSHFFRSGIPSSVVTGEQWSAFTTSNVGYYSSLDGSNSPLPFGSDNFNTSNISNAVQSESYNGSWNPVSRPEFYNSAEDISGAAFFFTNPGNKPDNTSVSYHTKVFLPSFTANPMNIVTNTRNVLRTDRLPSSDGLDGASWTLNPSLLQQNLNFTVYQINDFGVGNTLTGYGTGADLTTEDLEGQFGSTNVFDTLNVCSEIVSLSCYAGTGTGFTVNQNCADKDAVVNGCYTFVKKLFIDIPKDIRNFNEWAYRFRFNFGLCRGVLSQTFTNNWINGSLFMFPIQVDVTFNSQNKANPPIFPRKLVYFDSSTNNFYFRSTPFKLSTNRFIGRPTDTDANPVNNRNLLFPTTIMNLGMKDSFYGEIILEPSTRGYVMDKLNPSSYSDTSDIVNLFVLSRITNSSFLQRMLGSRDKSIDSLFTRYGRALIERRQRVDADLVQMMSINTEVGNVPFSPEYYPFSNNNPNNAVVVIAQNNENSTMGIFFSSTTEDLQLKDFLTPGVIDFRFNPNVTAVTYKYGIKSQRVPFYQWFLSNNTSVPSIFGSETNNWATNLSDIVPSNYQDLDRRNIITPNYFVPRITSLDVNQRAYIFNIDNNGFYDLNTFQGMKTKFMVGAPYQFYFGLVKGGSALDKFKQKYLPNE